MLVLCISLYSSINYQIHTTSLSNMSIFYHEEPPNSTKRCKFLSLALKDAFFNCRTFGDRVSTSSEKDDYPATDSEDELEVVVEVIRSRAMEAKLRRRAGFMSDSFSGVFSPIAGELFATPKRVQQKEDNDGKDEDREDFFSAGSSFSLCSSAASREAFFSPKTNFSRSSSLNRFDFPVSSSWRRSVIQELCHCEGWPFGLGRKAVLLPPLPKSPSESWLWRKRIRTVKLP